MFTTNCPKCDKLFRLDDKLRGRTALCPICRTKFTLPSEEILEVEEFEEIVDDAITATKPVPRPRTPVRSGPPPAFHEDDIEEFPRKKKKKKKKRRRGLSFLSGPMSFQKILSILGTVWLVTLVPGIVFGPLLLIHILVGAILLFVSNIMIIYVAFNEDLACGLMLLFVPFYSLYYIITRFDEVAESLLLMAIGFGFVMGGTVALGMYTAVAHNVR